MIDQDFRDGDSTEVKSRVSYELSPGYSLFTELAYNWRDYDLLAGGSSQGWRSLTGVSFEVGRLIRGDVGIGYMSQDFQGRAGRIDLHLSRRAEVGYPMPPMTVALDADRVVKDSAMAGAAGSVSDTAALRVDYEVLRGTVLTPMASISHIDYIGIAQDGIEYQLGVQLDRSVNRFLSVGLLY